MTQIYLISPDKISSDSFFSNLDNLLSTGLISLFQLRLKQYNDQAVISIGEKILKICHKHNIKLILNDRYDLALKINADGVHLGADDGNWEEVSRNRYKDFLWGVSCYDNKKLIHKAINLKADYISLGAFFPTKTKKSLGKPNIDLIDYCKKITNIDIVAIGGINDKNYTKLIKADYLAVISYIWNSDNPINNLQKLKI